MKAVAVLGTSGGVSFALGFEEALSEVGNNTGNVLFQHALWKIIQNPKFTVALWSDPDYVRHADVLIIPSANQINPAFNLSSWTQFVETVDLPCVVIGLGAQAPIDGDLELSEGIIRYAKAIASRSGVMGVRGEYTRQVLEKIGITNTIVTGCPSQTINSRITGNHIQSQIDAVKGNPKPTIAVLAGTMEEGTRSVEKVLYSLGENPVVFQTNPHILRLLHDGTMSGEAQKYLSWQSKVVGVPDYPEYLQKYGRFYSDARSWVDSMARFDVAVGMRIHGAVAAIQAGSLGICIAFDSRTLELAKTMGYPYVLASEVEVGMTLNDILSKIIFDPTEFDLRKNENSRRINEILVNAGIQIPLLK